MKNSKTSAAGKPRRRRRHYSHGEKADRAIARLFEVSGVPSNDDFAREMVTSILKLSAQGADRGEMKIINLAMKELRHSFRVFAPYSGVPKVSIFGSARVDDTHPAAVEARRFAARIVENGYMVITGGADGIMHAGNIGAGRENSFGVNIILPWEPEANPVIQDDPKLVNFKYFFARKLIFVKESAAIAVFPGGFGTHDECFEILTLLQTGKADPRPVVLVEQPGGSYWQGWIDCVNEQMLGSGYIRERDLCLFHRSAGADDAVDHIMHFYRRYHSIRFVGEWLVLRLKTPISDSALSELNKEFGSILKKGAIERCAPFEQEASEPELLRLPRLRLLFKRRNYAELRLLIDRLNDFPAG